MAETATKPPVRDEGKQPAKRSEWPSFGDLRREVDRLFEDFGREWFAMPARWPEREPFLRWDTKFDLQPAVDVVEGEGSYRMTIELPGIDPKNIDVRLADNYLTIKGEKTETKEETDRNAHISERHYGSFERSFRLPGGLDRSKIEANFKDGVLTLTLPKTAQVMTDETKVEVKRPD